jgi:hypothetical protein
MLHSVQAHDSRTSQALPFAGFELVPGTCARLQPVLRRHELRLDLHQVVHRGLFADQGEAGPLLVDQGPML